jgi:hypothetical protein
MLRVTMRLDEKQKQKSKTHDNHQAEPFRAENDHDQPWPSRMHWNRRVLSRLRAIFGDETTALVPREWRLKPDTTTKYQPTAGQKHTE